MIKALYSRPRLYKVQVITSLSSNFKSFTFRLVEMCLIIIKKFFIIPKEERVALKNSLNRINSEENPQGIYKRLNWAYILIGFLIIKIYRSGPSI